MYYRYYYPQNTYYTSSNDNRLIGPGGFLVPFGLGLLTGPLVFGPRPGFGPRPRPYYPPYPYY